MRTTKAILVLTVLLLLVWEFYALACLDGATISEAVWDWSRDYPLVPFLAGGLCGHFFWQRKR